MMAVHKAIRSTSTAQPQPHQAKTARVGGPTQPKSGRPGSNHQLKAELFEALRHLNRGYGVALYSLDRLEAKDHLQKPRAFPAGFLASYRNRTEILRAQANLDLLRFLAGREEHEAERFGRLCGPPAEPKHKRRS
jgi:hypothetical protein